MLFCKKTWQKRVVDLFSKWAYFQETTVLRASHSAATSAHFGTIKTWRRRFYWRGMANQVKEMVCFLTKVLLMINDNDCLYIFVKAGSRYDAGPCVAM